MSTTLSFSTTSVTTTTLTSTASTTTTTTNTVTLTSTSSYYAACATDGPNYLSQINGGYIDHDTGAAATYNQFSTDTAYDCCVSCFTSGSCIGSFFGVASGNAPGTCYNLGANSCSSQSQNSGMSLKNYRNSSCSLTINARWLLRPIKPRLWTIYC